LTLCTRGSSVGDIPRRFAAVRYDEMRKQIRKLKLSRESLRRLTALPAEATREVQGGAATLPPVCEHTNFISCNTNCNVCH
jgi:hypothetical protein